MISENWYVIHTKSKSEERVRKLLQAKDVEVFIPKMQVMRKRLGTVFAVSEPVFPRYVFSRMRLTSSFLHQLRWTPGVVRMLTFNGIPSPVPSGVIDFLKGRSMDGFVRPESRFSKGDTVRFTGGPFEGLEGVIEEARSGKERVKILMDILHKSTRVEAHVLELEKVSDIGYSVTRLRSKPRVSTCS